MLACTTRPAGLLRRPMLIRAPPFAVCPAFMICASKCNEGFARTPETRSIMLCPASLSYTTATATAFAFSADGTIDAACDRPPSGWLQMRPSARAPGSPPPRSPQRPPPLDLSAVHGMRLTPDRCSFAGVETPGDQEARGEGSLQEIMCLLKVFVPRRLTQQVARLISCCQ